MKKSNFPRNFNRPKPQKTLEDRTDFPSEAILGRRPVLEALKAETTIDRVIIRLGSSGSIIGEIIEAAKRRDVRIDRLTTEVFDKKFEHKISGGAAAFTAAAKTISLQELLASDRSGRLPVVALLDGIEDPHNLGAIARSAEAAGALGVIIPGHRTAPLSQTALKASAGALAHIPVVRVNNLASAMEELKKAGYWIYGADMTGKDYRVVSFNSPAALVIGAEGKGLSRLVKDKCDTLVGIPLRGKVESLNASVSAGILIFELVRKLGGNN